MPEIAPPTPLYLVNDRQWSPTLNDLLEMVARKGGSDLLVSVDATLKIKIGGALQTVMPRAMTSDDVTGFLVGSLNSEQVVQFEATKEINCAIAIAGVGRFRLSGFYQRGTQAFVVRFVPPEIPSCDALGLPKILRNLVMQKRGLIIASGPTGSGKTTSLASLVNLRNQSSADHIMMVEDPIEFVFRHRKSIVNQREVGTDTDSFEEALRNAMRQAPDLLVIGEIRDQRTMNLAMQYAQSGHLVMATLHASNSYFALNRIVNFYPPDQRSALFSDLSASLKAIFAQRLVPTIRGDRVAAIEILMNTLGVSELIAKGDISALPDRMSKTLSEGTQTFEIVLMNMVKRGAISAETAVEFADSQTNIYWHLASIGMQPDPQKALNMGVDRDQVAKVAGGGALAPRESLSAIPRATS